MAIHKAVTDSNLASIITSGTIGSLLNQKALVPKLTIHHLLCIHCTESSPIALRPSAIVTLINVGIKKHKIAVFSKATLKNANGWQLLINPDVDFVQEGNLHIGGTSDEERFVNIIDAYNAGPILDQLRISLLGEMRSLIYENHFSLAMLPMERMSKLVDRFPVQLISDDLDLSLFMLRQTYLPINEVNDLIMYKILKRRYFSYSAIPSIQGVIDQGVHVSDKLLKRMLYQFPNSTMGDILADLFTDAHLRKVVEEILTECFTNNAPHTQTLAIVDSLVQSFEIPIATVSKCFMDSAVEVEERWMEEVNNFTFALRSDLLIHNIPVKINHKNVSNFDNRYLKTRFAKNNGYLNGRIWNFSLRFFGADSECTEACLNDLLITESCSSPTEEWDLICSINTLLRNRVFINPDIIEYIGEVVFCEGPIPARFIVLLAHIQRHWDCLENVVKLKENLKKLSNNPGWNRESNSYLDYAISFIPGFLHYRLFGINDHVRFKNALDNIGTGNEFMVWKQEIDDENKKRLIAQ